MEKFADKLFQSLSSLKLTIFLLLGLAVASIPGTLVDPNKATYDFYHSWWFTSLLFLLAINLTACTFYRKQGRLSVWLIHSSIFFILIGGIVGSRFGFSTLLNLENGEVASAVSKPRSLKKIHLPFEVRSDEFRLRFYQGTSRPSDFETDLTILEEGKPVVSKTIRVNDPLRYKGISFYQASYGDIPKGFALQVKDQETGKIIVEKNVGFGEPIKVAKEDIEFQVLNYFSNLEGFGPAAAIQFKRGKGPLFRGLIFQNYPNFESKRRGRYIPILAGVNSSYYTGLQVVKDPGVPLVYLGCGLLIFGIALAFFSPKWRGVKLFSRKPKTKAEPDLTYAKAQS